MMEAQSVGIPIVARDVGGISELVTSRTGKLVSADASVAAIAQAVAQAIDENSFDRAEIRTAFAVRYEASANYAPFADKLLDLWASLA
jgi:glycosyltransferase involved in cell wall biosynthesis